MGYTGTNCETLYAAQTGGLGISPLGIVLICVCILLIICKLSSIFFIK